MDQQSHLVKTILYENHIYTVEKKRDQLFIKSTHYGFITDSEKDTLLFQLCITEEGHDHLVSHLEINPELSNLFLLSVTMARELLDGQHVYVFLDNSKEYYIIPINNPKFTVHLNIWTMYFYKKAWAEQMFGAFPTRYGSNYGCDEALFYVNEQCRLELPLTDKNRDLIQGYTAYGLDYSKFTHRFLEVDTVYEYIDYVKQVYPETYLNYLGGWYYHYLYKLSTFYWAVIIKSIPNVKYTIMSNERQNHTFPYYPLSGLVGGYTFTKWFIDGSSTYSLELPSAVNF